MTHPIRKPGQSHDEHQSEMAEWMGCSVEEMNLAHDQLHRMLAELSGYTSYAMRQADGLPIAPDEQKLADLEEEAVLHLQRYLHHAEKA